MNAVQQLRHYNNNLLNEWPILMMPGHVIRAGENKSR